MSGKPNDFYNPYAPSAFGAQSPFAPPKKSGSGASVAIALVAVLGVMLLGGCLVGAAGFGFLAYKVRSEEAARRNAAEARFDEFRAPTLPAVEDSLRDWQAEHQERMRQMHEEMEQRMQERQREHDEMMRNLHERPRAPPSFPGEPSSSAESP
jgi:uncharacterized protein HemX